MSKGGVLFMGLTDTLKGAKRNWHRKRKKKVKRLWPKEIQHNNESSKEKTNAILFFLSFFECNTCKTKTNITRVVLLLMYIVLHIISKSWDAMKSFCVMGLFGIFGPVFYIVK